MALKLTPGEERAARSFDKLYDLLRYLKRTGRITERRRVALFGRVSKLERELWGEANVPPKGAKKSWWERGRDR